jgi:hypothetical protein
MRSKDDLDEPAAITSRSGLHLGIYFLFSCMIDEFRLSMDSRSNLDRNLLRIGLER